MCTCYTHLQFSFVGDDDGNCLLAPEGWSHCRDEAQCAWVLPGDRGFPSWLSLSSGQSGCAGSRGAGTNTGGGCQSSLCSKALFNQNKNQGIRFIIDAFHTIPMDLKYYANNYSKY